MCLITKSGLFAEPPNANDLLSGMNTPSLNVPRPTASTLVTSSYVKTPPTIKLPVKDALPFESTRNLSVPSVVTLKCPFEPVSIVSTQPDLGTAVIIFLCGLSILWIGGINYKFFINRFF